MNLKHYDVHEISTGWWCPQTEWIYKTAEGADKAIKRREKKRVNPDAIAVGVVNWHCTTAIGTAVVKAITGEKRNDDVY